MRYNTSCPAGRPSSNALAVKSVSGRASTKTALRIVLKLSLVATSTSMRDGLSARAQTIAESRETSPDWTPWVITGRSAARLNAGLAMPPAAAIATDEAAVVKKRRRVSDAPLRMTAIGPPPSNHRGGSCPRRLTGTRHLCDSCVKTSQRARYETNPLSQKLPIAPIFIADKVSLAVFARKGRE